MKVDGLLRCPACKQGGLSDHRETTVRCNSCGWTFPRHDGYVDLLPPRAEEPSLAQATMESRALVSIYESRLWRRSPTIGFVLGLSFHREQALVQEGLGLRPADTVLDLACGPGIYTRPIARAVPKGRVVALDMSPPMLAHAARKAAQEGIDNVLWVRGDAMELPFPDGTLDAVNCCGALHLFPDMRHVIGEIRRVLRPSGRFVAAVVRRPKGPLGAVTSRAMLASGVTPFREEELSQALFEGGFDRREQHFGRRAWMIWSATKAA